MGKLRRRWNEIESALRGDGMSGEGRSMSERDPLAMAVAVLSLCSQIGIWIWWGSRMSERLDATVARVEKLEAKGDEAIRTDAAQDTSIAVISTQLSDIKSSVEKIADKVGAK